jgi:hypothetical protein
MKALGNLTLKDKRALLLYLGIVLFCAGCFAAGIFVGGALPRPHAARSAELPPASFIVRVFSLNSAEEAEQLSARVREQRQVTASVEAVSGAPSYAVRIGPFATRAAADDLTLELRNAGYSAVKVIAETPGP